ncbi:dimethylsulfonioproprionate lyase family protein [Ruegeria arenilitoris]|uniref:dimethylsulfonioproprionate lyase family protein n=1 Tax=Ruegeria arenilitoris TaxID=1173585 RepID=UPI00147DEA52|nr:dimethylsulfonioproprionate lyase family protein [Ruegeria arenilitoris]
MIGFRVARQQNLHSMSHADKPKSENWLSSLFMSKEGVYQNLLQQARDAYVSHPQMTSFAPFPDDIQRQEIEPYHLPCGDVLRQEEGLVSQTYAHLQDAIVNAAPYAVWRETYKYTDIGDCFLNNFGCYSIVGAGGPFLSNKLWLWIVHMPPQLYYPWHHHPAEEMYMVISGTGVFNREGCPSENLGEGGTVYHESNQPHAMETQDDPVLCLVAWRNRFDTPPVLTPSN